MMMGSDPYEKYILGACRLDQGYAVVENRTPDVTSAGMMRLRSRVPSLSRRDALAAGLAASLGLAGGPVIALSSLSIRRSADFVDSVGINTHFGHLGTPYADRFDLCAEALARLGIRHLRDDVIWGRETPPVQFQAIRALAARGHRFSLIFYDPNGPGPLTPPERLPEIVALSGGGLAIVEGSNEPPLLSNRASFPARSAFHQRSLSRIVQSDPRLAGIKVAGPSYIFGNIALAQNLSGAVDYANVHAYPGMEHPETDGPGNLKRFVAAVRPVFGSAPVLVTENGYHTALATADGHLPVSEGIRARYLPRMLLWAYLSGVTRTYLYELVSSFDHGDADPESRFGLLTYDGTETPGFAAVRNLMALFRSPGVARPDDGPSVSIELDGPVEALQGAAFRRADGTILVPVWIGVSGWDPGSRKPLPDLPGRPIEVRLSRAPTTASLHRFADDGSVTVDAVNATRTIGLSASDHLSVLSLAF